MEIIKNPILIGLCVSGAAYGYLSYSANEQNKKNIKKKKIKKETVDLTIPFVLFVIVWFIAYAYFEYNTEPSASNGVENIVAPVGDFVPMPVLLSPKYGFIKDVMSDTSDPKSFTLISSGINIPSQLPDVLLDVN